MTLVIPGTPGMLRSLGFLGSPGTPGISGMLIYLGTPGTIDPRDPRIQRGVRSKIYNPPSLATVNNRQQFFVLWNLPSPLTVKSRTLTFLLPTLSPLLPSTTVNIFSFLDPPSPPTVNNRQQFLNSKPSHPPPLKCWRNMWMTPKGSHWIQKGNCKITENIYPLYCIKELLFSMKDTN